MGLDFARSGTRVVALGYSSNEARVFRTFHDRELNFDCAFVADAAGRDQRCVPTTEVTMVYTDASCTEPGAWADDGQPHPLQPGEAVSGGLGFETTCPGDAPSHREAYRVGERVRERALNGPLEGLFQIYGGRCQTASPPAKFFPAVVRLTPIPESELARGHRTSVDVGGGLRLTRLLADDGAQLTLGVTGEDGTPCEFQRDGECVPEPIARPAALLSDKFYTALDADCSAPAFQMPYQGECGVPTLGVDDDGTRPLRIQAMVPATAIFGLDLLEPVSDAVAFQCTPKQVVDYGWVAAPGTDLTGTLPRASSLRRGGGELHVDWFALDDRELLPTGGARSSWGEVPTGRFANRDGRICDVMPAPDGRLPCVFTDVPPVPPVEVTAFTY